MKVSVKILLEFLYLQSTVMLAKHSGDHAIYPDSRPEALEGFAPTEYEK